MKKLKIILAFIISMDSSFIFAEELDLDLVVTTDEVEGYVFNIVNNEKASEHIRTAWHTIRKYLIAELGKDIDNSWFDKV